VPVHHIVVLALIQGITEFLPISSSGHLVLVPVLTGWRDQGLVIDVAVHVGTLLAVILYFRRDVGEMILGFVRSPADGSGRRGWRCSSASPRYRRLRPGCCCTSWPAGCFGRKEAMPRSSPP
jgi:undecaprenyl pyrophosphate phosphatase UppP